MNITTIEWTDYTTNPFKARHKALAPGEQTCPRCKMPAKSVGKLFNFCVRVSEGCSNCYACTLTHRWGGPDYAAGMQQCLEPVLVEKELQAILKFKGPAGTKIFAFDMTDIFFDFWPDKFRDKFFAVAALRPDLIFQLLTKRAERMYDYRTRLADNQTHLSAAGCWASDMANWLVYSGLSKRKPDEANGSDYLFDRLLAAARSNFPNLWKGVSVENQKHANERHSWLMKTPAAKRFLSLEPLLDSIDVSPFLPHYRCGDCGASGAKSIHPADSQTFEFYENIEEVKGVDWVIVGSESGQGARPMDDDWVRSVRDACEDADVPFFFKQRTVKGKKIGLPSLDGAIWNQYPDAEDACF